MILGIFAHPDDELFAAALLAQRARTGEQVEIVVATRGEAGWSSIDSDQPLAELRSAELHMSCKALGIAPPLILELPDSKLETRAAELERQIRTLVDERQPTTIITTGPDGVYGHLDHIAITHAVDQIAACEVLYTAFPRGFFDELRSALSQVPGVPLAAASSQLGVDRAQVHLIVEVEPVRGEKKRAIASHRSQLRGGEFLLPGLAKHMLAVEWYTRRDP